jgi:hypothetical protein
VSGLFSTSIVFILALMNDRWEIVLLSVVLAGALLGFLRYNFGSASVFLGDSGSLFVGFALAALAVRGSMKSSTAVAVLAPLLALGFPIVDTSMALVRRLVGRKSLLEPDADHIHHRIVRMGLTQQRAVIILYGVTALFGALSLLTMTGQSHATGLAAVVFTLVTWIGIRQLGYSELGQIQRLLKRGPFARGPDLGHGVPARGGAAGGGRGQGPAPAPCRPGVGGLRAAPREGVGASARARASPASVGGCRRRAGPPSLVDLDDPAGERARAAG